MHTHTHADAHAHAPTHARVYAGTDINGSGNNMKFGTSTAISTDGNTVATGSPSGSKNNKGCVAVYDFDELTSVWRKRGRFVVAVDCS